MKSVYEDSEVIPDRVYADSEVIPDNVQPKQGSAIHEFGQGLIGREGSGAAHWAGSITPATAGAIGGTIIPGVGSVLGAAAMQTAQEAANAWLPGKPKEKGILGPAVDVALAAGGQKAGDILMSKLFPKIAGAVVGTNVDDMPKVGEQVSEEFVDSLTKSIRTFGRKALSLDTGVDFGDVSLLIKSPEKIMARIGKVNPEKLFYDKNSLIVGDMTRRVMNSEDPIKTIANMYTDKTIKDSLEKEIMNAGFDSFETYLKSMEPFVIDHAAFAFTPWLRKGLIPTSMGGIGLELLGAPIHATSGIPIVSMVTSPRLVGHAVGYSVIAAKAIKDVASTMSINPAVLEGAIQSLVQQGVISMPTLDIKDTPDPVKPEKQTKEVTKLGQEPASKKFRDEMSKLDKKGAYAPQEDETMVGGN